jgi:hypothetical protein
MRYLAILFASALSTISASLAVEVFEKTDFVDTMNRTSDEKLGSRLYDYEGKIVQIKFPSDNPKQISKDFFALNGGSGSNRYVVHIPSEIGQKYFGGTRRTPPPALFARVTIRTLINAFGVESQGALLVGLGTTSKQLMSDKIVISW